MKPLAAILSLCLALSASASTYTVATVTVTNAPANGETLVVGSDTRTWTNAVFNPATQILRGTNAALSAANLILAVNAQPFSGLTFSVPGANAIQLMTAADAAMPVITLTTNWGTVALATNVYTPAIVVRIPLSVETAENRTNIASALGAAVNSSANTNPVTVLATNIVGAVPQAGHSTNADNAILAANATAAYSPSTTNTPATSLLGLAPDGEFSATFAVTNSPPTNAVLGWLSIAIGGTNYYIPLCSTNGP